MDDQGVYYKVLSDEEILAKFGSKDLLPIKLEKSTTTKLKTNLIIPPKYQSYSLAIEYMSDWFYKKWPKYFFHHKYLDASHVMDQFRKLKTRDLIVLNKPAAHIAVNEDPSYNRNNIDLHNMGVTIYENRAGIKNSFFIDREKNIYITMVPRQIKLGFKFSIRVSTKSVQDDVAEIADMTFRANGSQKHYIDADFPVPKELIGQIATDVGLCRDGKYRVDEMLKYLNSKSNLPFLYKFNPAINDMDYFLRLPHILVHIRTGGIEKSEASMRNMSATDFIASFDCEVLFPAIKFFAYYSMIQRESLHSITQLDAKSFLFGVTNLCNIPPVNEKGWQWSYRKTCTLNDKEEIEKINNKELITIDMDNFFNNKVIDIINYTKYIALSPEVFIDIKAFNFTKYIPISINWNCLKLTFEEPLETQEVYLIFYMDNKYIHDTIKLLEDHKNTRMRDAKDHIGPLKNLGTKLPNL